MYDSKVIRVLKKSVYGIASHIGLSSAVAVSGFSNLDKLDDDVRIVIGFSPLNEGFGKKPSAEELCKDALLDDLGLDCLLVVTEDLSKLLTSNIGGMSMFKCLNESESIILDERLRRQIDFHITLDSCFDAGRILAAPGWRRRLEEASVAGLVSAFGFSKALRDWQCFRRTK